MRDFAGIFQEFHPKIFRYLCRVVGETDAADLTQAVFLKVSQSLHNFRGDASVGTWIYRIATNVARDHALSSSKKLRATEITIEDACSVANMTGTERGPDEAYVRKEMNACIRGLIDQLPETYRTVLILTDLEEFTRAEVSEILGISLENVKIRLHRARLAMRKVMQCQCSFYRDERNQLLCDRRAEV